MEPPYVNVLERVVFSKFSPKTEGSDFKIEGYHVNVEELLKLQGIGRGSLRPATLLKKGLWHRCFLENFAKFLKTTFLQNTTDYFWIGQPFERNLNLQYKNLSSGHILVLRECYIFKQKLLKMSTCDRKKTLS